MKKSNMLFLLLSASVLTSCAEKQKAVRPAPEPVDEQTEIDVSPEIVVTENQPAPPETPVTPAPKFDRQSTVNKTTKVSSPAVVALLSDAETQSDAGNLESAVVTIERALRIEPRNPLLIYKLAELRLQQEKPRLAEDLAKKSVLLSGQDRALKRQGWLLIAQARLAQGNQQGAKEAEQKAAQYE